LEKTWLPIVTLMLEHGADPYACCVDDVHSLLRSAGFTEESANYPKAAGHLNNEGRLQAKAKRGCDPESWDTLNSHAYFHSLTAVVDHVFKAHSILPGYKDLIDLLEAKKKVRAPVKRRGMENAAVNTILRPDWVS
jgi:hypothetical protein